MPRGASNGRATSETPIDFKPFATRRISRMPALPPAGVSDAADPWFEEKADTVFIDAFDEVNDICAAARAASIMTRFERFETDVTS